MLAHKLVGTAMQMAVCQLEAGQSVYCEAGFLWKTQNVEVETRLTRPASSSTGPGTPGLIYQVVDVGRRMLAGEGLAFQHYTARGGTGLVTFAGVLPGEMRALELEPSRGWFAERDAFVAAESTVDVDTAFSGGRNGQRSGEGLVLEHFTGSGTLLLAGAGTVIELNPARYGGRIDVDTGCVVAFQDTITYDVKRVAALSAQGAVTSLLGGEGLSLATLQGDGSVVLQSTTIPALARALAQLPAADGRKRPFGRLAGNPD